MTKNHQAALIKHRLNNIWIIIKKIFAHFWATEGFLSSTALAYTTLLSIVPLMILSLGIFSFFPSFKTYLHEADNFLFEHFVPTSAQEIAKNIASFSETAPGHSAAGFLFSLVSSLILIYALESAFNWIWQVKARRHLLTALWMYCLALLILPFASAAVFAIHVFLFSLPFLASLGSFWGWTPVLNLIPLVFTWLTFFLLYKFLPNCLVPARHAAMGAAVAALLFEVLKRVFAIYINYFSSFEIIYGTLAAVPIFLTWLYFSWMIVLLGVVVSFVLANPTHKAGPKKLQSST